MCYALVGAPDALRANFYGALNANVKRMKNPDTGDLSDSSHTY